MFKLALFCSLLILVSAKLSTVSMLFDLTDPDDEELHLEEKFLKAKVDLKDALSEDLWVLEIDDFLLSSVTLWAGNKAEEKEFEDAFGPLIDRYEERQRRRIRKAPIPKRKETDNTDDDDEMTVKGAIMRIVNKFVLSAMTDPSSYLFENGKGVDNPCLTLYFKGPYSSLSVNSGGDKRRYFISPPSPLPRWFYEKHPDAKRAGQAVYVEAPKDVEIEFYKSLLNLLHRFLSVPF